MKITSCRFDRSVFRPDDAPRSPDPDVAFVGRSNVGKSSLINRLLGVKGLARTSSTPGRTRSVNVFRINEAFHFLDLPGYGFARVSKSVRSSWGPLVEGVLEARLERIAMTVLLVDARHGPTEMDAQMAVWLADRSVPFLVAATKADKLAAAARARAGRELAVGLAGAEILLVSAVTGLGITDIWRRLDQALAERKERVWTSAS